jgi:hypothetical protein
MMITPWALAAVEALISSRCFCMASVLAWGITKAAPLSRAGQTALNI